MTHTTLNTTEHSLFIPGIVVRTLSISGQESAIHTNLMKPASSQSQFDCDGIMHACNFLTMKRLLTTLLILISTSLFAQQDALYSQYMFNKLAINAGYAGSRELISADILYRYQWVNIEGAPKTVSASIHAPLSNPHLAMGFSVSNDRLGPLTCIA